MSRILQETSEYKPSPLAKIFHAFPHLNVSLHLVNSTFAPESELYRESIGILGSVPAAWLILTLFLLLVYLLTRCCDRKPRPKHSILILRWTLFIFVILCGMAIAVSLYGNDDLHNGVLQFMKAARNVNERIERVQNQTNAIENALQSTIPDILHNLQDVFDKAVQNQTAVSKLFAERNHFNETMTAVLMSSRDISRPLKHLNIRHTISLIYLGETIRWPVTMGIYSALLIFCVVLLFGLIKSSRCALIMFSVVGLFAVIISLLLASVYLAASVATGDFCMAPDVYVERESPPSLQADILTYYINCESSRSNPFTMVVRKGSNAAKNMSSHLNEISRIAKDLYQPSDIYPQLTVLTTQVKDVYDKMTGLAALLECRTIHKEYRQMLLAVCDLGLYGLAFMLAGSIVSGFFFTILVWLDSHTWIYIRKKQDYAQVDEQDPFLPPSAASQAVAARTLRNQGLYKYPFNNATSSTATPYACCSTSLMMTNVHVHAA